MTKERVLADMRTQFSGWQHYFVNGPYDDGSYFAGAYESFGQGSGSAWCEKSDSLAKLSRLVRSAGPKP